MLTPDRLEEIVAELAGRPGHEKVRALTYGLLVDGLGVASPDIRFEQPLAEVRGRTDALLGETVFEFKRDLRAEATDAQEGLKRYLADREHQTGRRFLGIATDGAAFVAYERRAGELVELRRYAVHRDRAAELLVWLGAAVSISPALDPDPETVRRELGRDSVAYQRARVRLQEVWAQVRGDEGVQLKRRLWSDLLEKVYGSDVTGDDLFFQHTYLSIVSKTMAAAILGIDIPDPEDLLHGRPFADAGIAGAVEADFFDWPLALESGREAVARIARQAARFRLADVEHDVLKGLYESLIDPEQRHDLGEYYTPDWLAARMLDRLVDDPLGKRVLDPACGSGTFLFHAVRQVLSTASTGHLSDREAVIRCCTQVLGVDVHPVAVLIARVTYLLAIGEQRLRDHPSFSIPVYLGDSLQWNTMAFLSRREVEIRVPDGKPLYFPFAVTRDAGTFDAALDAMLRLSEGGAEPEAMRAWLDREAVGDDADRDRMVETYRELRSLHQRGKDHIWGYVARNLVRPIWLSSDEERADLIIGNPPWLSYRYMSADMQQRFREECERRGLWAGGKVATHQDLSAYFFARCVELYLKPGGRIGFVMPYAALSRRQFDGFRKGTFGATSVRFTEAWTFDERVQPLFPVPSCALFAVQEPPGPLPGTITECAGELPRRDATPAEADIALTSGKAPWPTAGRDVASAYRDAFRQGATVVPQVFFRVERPPAGRLGADPAAPVVVSRRTRLEKAPWREVASLRGRVESQFLRPLYLGESLAPFRLLTPVLAVIPWDPAQGAFFDSAAAQRAGYPAVASWLRDAERLWKGHGRGSMTLLERLDFQRELSAQMPPGPIRVVYTASGSIPAAAILRDERAVVEHKLYWAALGTEDEARYLEAVLSSETARARVERLQSRGQWGTRDFDKLLVELPLPKYDGSIPLHRALAVAAKTAEDVASRAPIPAGAHFTRTRRSIRDALVASGISPDIDEMVVALLAGRTDLSPPTQYAAIADDREALRKVAEERGSYGRD